MDEHTVLAEVQHLFCQTHISRLSISFFDGDVLLFRGVAPRKAVKGEEGGKSPDV